MRPAALAGLLALVAALIARRHLDVVEVRGRSMAPTLLPGDRLVARRAPPRVGDVVLVPDPRDPRRELIKRVAALGASGAWLRGDNPAASTDARTFGTVPLGPEAWRVVARYWPPHRAGRLPGVPASFERLDEGGEPACAFPDALVGPAELL